MDSQEKRKGETGTNEQFYELLKAYNMQAEDMVKKILDEMPGGFFVYQADGDEKIIYVNKAMLRIFGCDTVEEFKELTGNTFKGIVHPDDLEAVEESILRQIEESHYDLDYVEYRIIRKDGGIRWIEDYGHFIHSNLVGDVFYVFVADATDKREKQIEMLEDALWHAKVADKAKDIFFANMSHDMRTPMNAILGAAALAKKNIGNKEKAESYLDKIMESGDNLLSLINDVLELSRMDTGSVHLENVKCNLDEIIKEVHMNLLPKAENKRITFLTDTSALRHRNIYSDAEKLKQVFRHICNNAVEYTGVGGRISFVAEELDKSGTYRFVVEDNGMGMSEEFQRRMFEPFERQKNSTMSRVSGTGLGLTIVKSIVDIMDGSIEVSSKEGIGTRFIVILKFRPWKHEDVQKVSEIKDTPVTEGVHESKKTDNARSGRARRGRILLVEDNEVNLELEVELLQDEGFSIDTAEDGHVAVEKIRNSRPGEYALILMDIQMPVMNGYQAAREIRLLEDTRLSNIPIIAVSANTFEEDRQRSMESGMDEHVGKPVNIIQLVKMIDKLCGMDE